MAIADIRVIPIGTKTPSLTDYVALAVKAIRDEKDIRYQLTPTGTILEGSLEKLLDAVRRMHEAAFSTEVVRVVTTVEIDERRDKQTPMEAKVEAVQRKLQ